MYEKVYFRMHKCTMIKNQKAAKKKVYVKKWQVSVCKCIRCPVCQGKKKKLFQIYGLNNCYFSTCSVRLRLKDVLTFCWYCYELLHCSCVTGTNFCTPSTSIDVLRHVAIVDQNCGSVDKPISSAFLWFRKTSYSSTKPLIIYYQNLKCFFSLYINQA